MKLRENVSENVYKTFSNTCSINCIVCLKTRYRTCVFDISIGIGIGISIGYELLRVLLPTQAEFCRVYFSLSLSSNELFETY